MTATKNDHFLLPVPTATIHKNKQQIYYLKK